MMTTNNKTPLTHEESEGSIIITIGEYCSWFLSYDENGYAILIPGDDILDAMLACDEFDLLDRPDGT